MGIYFVRFLLMLKSRLKSPFTYLWAVLIYSVLLLVNRTIIPLEAPADVFILNEAGEYGDRILELLNDDKTLSAYRYIEAQDEESLREAVISGRAHLGFILPEDIEKRASSGDTKKMITMVTSVFSVKSAAIRERVFAALFRVMNIDIVENAEKDIFEDPEEVKHFIRERYDHYSSGRDVFGIEYEYVKTDGSEKIDILKDSSDPVRGCTSVLIFILSLYSGGALLGKKGTFFKSLSKKDRFISIASYELSSVALPALAGIVSIRVFDPYGADFLSDILCYIVFVVFSCIWSSVFILFFRKSETYYPVVSVLLFVSFVLSPVFADIAGFIPVIGYVSRVLPPAFYLYML